MEPAHNPGLDSSRFCSRCSTINFDSLSESSYKPSHHNDILTIEGTTDESWASPSCALCQLFKATASPPAYKNLGPLLAWQNERSVTLLSPDKAGQIVGDTKSHVLIVKNKQGAQFYPDPDRSLCLQSDTAQTIRVLNPQHIDFRILEQWLSTCYESHGKSCGLEETVVIQGLQVINVHTQQVENAVKGARYVALSYMWGQQKQTGPSTPLSDSQTQQAEGPSKSPGFLDTDSHEFPPTIRDAMTATKKMGFQYLWVDRYCIPQYESKSKERTDQIKQMDRIYRQAELTLIAAAGQGPDHGLPGVGSTPRIPQPSLRIGKHILVSTMTPPRALIYSSPWYSRAWTYQEGICSRRRLLFTDEQVFFECQQMSCRETVDYMWPISDSLNPLREYYIFSEVHTTQGGLDSALQHIMSYSKRQLTYDSDALNAILGVLRLYSRKDIPVFHFWGVLIAPRYFIDAEAPWETAFETFCQVFLHTSSRSLDSGTLRKAMRYALLNIRWGFPSRQTLQNIICKTFLQTKRLFSSHDSMEKTFIKSLCWVPDTTGRRRPEFPSWSWAGWTCPVRYSGVAYEPRRYAVTVSIGFKSGRFKSLEYVYRHHILPDNLEDIVGILRLRAMVVKLKTNVLQKNLHDGKDIGMEVLYAWPMDQDKEFGEEQLVAPVRLLEPMDPGTIAGWQKESPHLLGIFMEYYEDEHLPKDVLVLVAAKVDHLKYQRVGHLLLDSGLGTGGRMKSKNVVTGDYVRIDVDERIRRQSNSRLPDYTSTAIQTFTK
ncbi:heterokaryon incompatibility protein-domain-containing protein [Fusarium flagelliforme]|uniref:heterokaryon incompatibility protein-domain-containing protein n=1 Tax=Fusarium flagelliforme TaxID=2675880 RepID=UPI001E8D6892|nr:heterokaryon incompatibility protein-domain-containing protein [Fusarium flagelliforme]KAH7179027.1 heterokaryon incompatibility protein-domain-containing protein [Fusarium flagelliforme]